MVLAADYKALTPSLLIASVCVLNICAFPLITFDNTLSIHSSLLYHFSHANIFHLVANLMALMYFKPRWSTCIVAYISATIASMLPFTSLALPTCGLSGFVFAAFARKYYFWQYNVTRLLIILAVSGFIPNINWKIHIVSFLISYMIWICIDTYKTIKYYHII